MPSVIVVGGGLAGLAAATALADSGFQVDLFEQRPFSGGRATSYAVPRPDGTSVILDNCQHILLRCCVNLLDFYRRLGVSDQLEFHREFYWIEPGGRMSVFRAGSLTAPAHFTESFLTLRFLTVAEKLAVGRGMLSILRERRSSAELDSVSMMEWLRQAGQPERVIERFWRQVLVSAVNEELSAMSSYHGVQVFRLGFLASSEAYEMGVPTGTLADLYTLSERGNLRLHFRQAVASLSDAARLSDGSEAKADYYVSALPVHRIGTVLPWYTPPLIEHSPITGVHLRFDRSITDLPHATLLDRNTQWLFNKGGGRSLQLVISASRPQTAMSKGEVIDMCLRELAEFFPVVRDAKLLDAHVVKEVRATISVKPGLAASRPGSATERPNVFIAGDWTATGWPSTMEGAVRSGYAAAEGVCRAAGRPHKFVLPDID